MTQKFRKWDEYQLEGLTDPEAALAYLEVAIEEYQNDGDKAAFLLALRFVVNAQGGIGKLAERTKLDRKHLYKALSAKGNPRLDTLGRILNGIGFQLSVERLKLEHS